MYFSLRDDVWCNNSIASVQAARKPIISSSLLLYLAQTKHKWKSELWGLNREKMSIYHSPLMLILFGLFVRQNGGISIMIGQKACQSNSRRRVKSLPTFFLIPEAVSLGYKPQ